VEEVVVVAGLVVVVVLLELELPSQVVQSSCRFQLAQVLLPSADLLLVVVALLELELELLEPQLFQSPFEAEVVAVTGLVEVVVVALLELELLEPQLFQSPLPVGSAGTVKQTWVEVTVPVQEGSQLFQSAPLALVVPSDFLLEVVVVAGLVEVLEPQLFQSPLPLALLEVVALLELELDLVELELLEPQLFQSPSAELEVVAVTGLVVLEVDLLELELLDEPQLFQSPLEAEVVVALVVVEEEVVVALVVEEEVDDPHGSHRLSVLTEVAGEAAAKPAKAAAAMRVDFILIGLVVLVSKE